MHVSILALTLAVTPLVACCNKGVKSFTVTPPLACSGDKVHVAWDVDGPTTLTTAPKSRPGVERSVSSQGSDDPVVLESMEFTITATKADPAKGNRMKMKPVDVPTTAEDKKVTTTCDAGGKCTGEFTLAPPRGTMHVVSISDPMINQSGHSAPGEACITHATLHDSCLVAGKPITASLPAEGTWQITTTVTASAPGDPPPPPPAIIVTVKFSCP